MLCCRFCVHRTDLCLHSISPSFFLFFSDAQRTLGQMINKNRYYSLISSSSKSKQLFTFQFFRLIDMSALATVPSFPCFLLQNFFCSLWCFGIVSPTFHKISRQLCRTLTKLIIINTFYSVHVVDVFHVGLFRCCFS